MSYRTNLTAAAIAAALIFTGAPRTAWSANGTWNVTTGDWDTPASWVGNIPADGANFTANFTQPDLGPGGLQRFGAPLIRRHDRCP